MGKQIWTDRAREVWQSYRSRSFANTVILAGTGHRPPRLGLGYTPADNELLTYFVRDWLQTLPVTPDLVVSGGAQGFDQALAHATSLLNIPYLVCVPFVGQEGQWPREAQQRYKAILKHAQEVVVVCPGDYNPAKFIERDRFMVDIATRVVALFDGLPKGGTHQTLVYARHAKRPVDNLWQKWQARAV